MLCLGIGWTNELKISARIKLKNVCDTQVKSPMTVDVFTKQERSEIMSMVRSKDTKPELLVRSYLHRSGLRFRLHQKDILGKPDIVLRKHRTLVFVHGCFWHQHKGCKNARMPKSNQDYWHPKLEGNVKRFKKNQAALKRMGWRVFVLWECEARKPDKLAKLVKKIKEHEKANL